MIVRMARVEIVGPHSLLLNTLTLIGMTATVQLDSPEPGAAGWTHLCADPEILRQRLSLQTLREKIIRLIEFFPDAPCRTVWLNPHDALPSLETLIDRHLNETATARNAVEELRREAARIEEQAMLLDAMQRLLAAAPPRTRLLDLLGITIRDPLLLPELQRETERLSGGRVALATSTTDNGTLIGVIAADPKLMKTIRETLLSEAVLELELPPELHELDPNHQSVLLRQRQTKLSGEATLRDTALNEFARRWLGFYRSAADWIDDRLLLLQAAGEVRESAFCFFVEGWMPTERIDEVRDLLTKQLQGQVLLQELELREEELEMAPVSLRNPPFLRPFELLLRLLPLPRYTSFDPTPLLGVGFPLLFGGMLGDAGYGAILCVLALYLRRQGSQLRDIGGILLPSALCAVAFGLFFGEFFGEEVAARIGLHPLFFTRSEGVVPMLWLALGVGVAHISLGLTLGLCGAMRVGARHEACRRFLHLAVVLALVAAVAALAMEMKAPLTTALIALGVTVPLLLVTGGVLAPLETIKTIGNIVSYARLMAIGLSSVLLAQVANSLGGASGNLFAGILIAATLHLFNLLLGLFAPTVHALRLHYVEFFSQFFETGGQSYRPLTQPHQQGGPSWKKP